jgi:hypothetical protein
MILDTNDIHYLLIKQFYGDKRAKRSQILYMNHIDEGLLILDCLYATVDAQRAFCLHPIVQHDSDVIHAHKHLYGAGIWPIALAMEYRSVANEYLSKRTITSLDEIRLSPLPEVNDMLIADKVQNYKDFKANKHLYENADRLEVYFQNWLDKLKITERMYTPS